jgi:hypothetical protein
MTMIAEPIPWLLSRLRWLPLVLLASLAAPVASGCGDDDTGGTCERNDQCGPGQLCTGGRCIDTTGRACRSSDECASGQTCENGLCATPDAGDTDTGMDVADQGQDPVVDLPVEDTPVQDTRDEEVATTPPQIVSTSPTAGQTGVGLDQVISLVWDQPMEAATFTVMTPSTPGGNLALTDWNGIPIERRATYNPPTFEVTLAPFEGTGLFTPASPYQLTVAREVRGANGLNPASRFELTFYTRGFAGIDHYEALAEAYAPVVYAEVRRPNPVDPRDLSPRMDFFTALDFDGDTNVANNLANLKVRATTIPAHVYWNVLETETHYLIQYIFYYAAGALGDNVRINDAVEHDFTYSTVVVRKLDDDPLGAFVLAEGLGDGQVFVFALNAYPSPCDGDEQPACIGATPDINDTWVTFAPALLEPAGDEEDEPGRRYPMYITPVRHASCLAPAYEPAGFRLGNRCIHNDGEGGPWKDGNNAAYSQVLRLGDTADHWGDPENTTNEMTYTMSPFLDLWWTQRANAQLWEDSRSYAIPPGGAGSGNIKHPSSLTTTTPVAASTSRRAPFQAEVDSGRACSGCSRVGVWFTDPAWELLGHADFDHDFSDDYCFNPFLGIDRRAHADCQ